MLQTGPAHLSPYIRGRFRLGLAVGVRALTRPACSNCSSALCSAEASIGSDVVRSCALAANTAWLRLWEAVGGVLDSGGEIKVGVAMPSSICAIDVATSSVLSCAMVAIALCCDDQRAQSANLAGGSEGGYDSTDWRGGRDKSYPVSRIRTGYQGRPARQMQVREVR
jgi:hypothetical protein